MTPADVHEGYAEAITERRAEVLKGAYDQHPERFVNKIPTRPPSTPRSGSTDQLKRR